MFLSNAAIKNRATVGVLMVLILVVGMFSYITLPREAAPDVPIPIILISTPYEGVSPEDIESAVTRKIEEKLTGLRGVKEIRSTSREGLSFIIVEFLPDVRIDDAMQYVRDKVELAKSDLPTEAEEPALTEINVAEFPIMLVNISGPISPVLMKVIADELQERMESLPGVLEVEMYGALEREIRLEFDPKLLAGYYISIQELISLIPGEHVNISAGGLETPGTKFNIRVPAEITDPGDVDNFLLTVRDGRPIYLSSVATVNDTFKDRESYARLDGEDTITLAIKKRIGANIIPIADSVQAVLAAARPQMPAGVELSVTMDRSEDIHRMVSDLENNMLSGLVLVVGVLMLFMGLRTALIVGLAIPMSMLISFAVLQAMGVTLNMIVLFSLILALGMLVDNAIVIVENIYRFMQMGHSRVNAAMKGTAQVAWPVVTSTLTTLAAFTPMLWWPGVVGDFMSYLPLTLIVVLSSSLFVALVISPTVACLVARVKGPERQSHEKHRLQLMYRRMLMVSLNHRAVTVILAVLLLVSVGVLYTKYGSGTRFFPKLDPKRAMVNIRSSQGTSVEYANLLAMEAEHRIVSQYPPRGVFMEHVIANVGSAGSNPFGGDSGGPHVSEITLVFPDYSKREIRSTEVLADLRERVADIPGAEIKVAEEQGGPPTGAAVTVRIMGEDFKELARISEEARQRIDGIPGLVNLRSDYEASRPELQFRVDRRRAMLLGVNSQIIGNFLKTSVFGSKVGTYRQFNDEYDITVRLPVSERQNIDDLFNLHVPDREGNPVPLSSLGEFVYAGGFGDIYRINQRRVITLTGDVEGRQPPEVLRDVMKALTPEQVRPTPAPVARLQQLLGKPAEEMPTEGVALPAGYTISYAGEKEEQDAAAAFLLRAFLIGCLAITLILVAQFNTLSVPLIIMLTVPLSLTGVWLGLLVTQTPFVVLMTGIGLISLAGVVVNNAIVLLAYTRDLQRQGLGVIEACAEAGMTRLRPVMLTAITTILGLLPMATGISFNFLQLQWETRSESSQWWSSMANAVIFGLAFGTLLTLIVVPTLYAIIFTRLEKHGWGGLLKADEKEEGDEGTPIQSRTEEALVG